MDTSDRNRPPLKPAAFHILLALAHSNLHGYGIMQAVRAQSAGRFPLQTGSLYRHLTMLIDLGLVTEASEPSVVDPRRGTHYRLTARGRQALELEGRYMAGVIATLGSLVPSFRKGKS